MPLDASPEPRPSVPPANPPAPVYDPRTRRLIEAPIARTLLRLAAPNMAVMLVQAGVGLVETWFIGRLGTAALAGMALAFPPVMLMQMMSAGAVGGGISSAVARALGGGRRDDADRLAVHAGVIAVALGAAFAAAMLIGARPLYRAMGGTGATLDAALTYTRIVFAGMVLLWLFNSLANVVRGTGNMMVPAAITIAGAVFLVPLSPALIFGWGPFPRLGVAGGGTAVLLYYGIGSAALVWYLRSRHSVVRLFLGGARLEWRLFRDILRVGAVAAVTTVQTNTTIAFVTGIVGAFGPTAIAGYGIGTRLEYLLVPLVFGLGGPLVAMVGTNIGAGRPERALRTAWIGAAIAVGLTETIGLAAAAFPRAWLGLFDSDATMIAAGVEYLRAVGPCYGFFGLGLALYFASQGAGRLGWPLVAGCARMLIACGGGWLVLHWGGDLTHIFLALGLALGAFGLINAAGVAGGAWFAGPRSAGVAARRN